MTRRVFFSALAFMLIGYLFLRATYFSHCSFKTALTENIIRTKTKDLKFNTTFSKKITNGGDSNDSNASKTKYAGESKSLSARLARNQSQTDSLSRH